MAPEGTQNSTLQGGVCRNAIWTALRGGPRGDPNRSPNFTPEATPKMNLEMSPCEEWPGPTRGTPSLPDFLPRGPEPARGQRKLDDSYTFSPTRRQAPGEAMGPLNELDLGAFRDRLGSLGDRFGVDVGSIWETDRHETAREFCRHLCAGFYGIALVFCSIIIFCKCQTRLQEAP